MDRLFCEGTGHHNPALSRGDIQRKTRLPTAGKFRFGTDDLICQYSSIFTRGIKNNAIGQNHYIWSNSNELIDKDASALTGGHGGKANDALNDTKITL